MAGALPFNFTASSVRLIGALEKDALVDAKRLTSASVICSERRILKMSRAAAFCIVTADDKLSWQATQLALLFYSYRCQAA